MKKVIFDGFMAALFLAAAIVFPTTIARICNGISCGIWVTMGIYDYFNRD